MSGSDSLHPIPPNNERTMSTSSASSSSTTSTNGSNRNSAPASLPQSPTHYAYQAPIHQTSSQVQYQSNGYPYPVYPVTQKEDTQKRPLMKRIIRFIKYGPID